MSKETGASSIGKRHSLPRLSYKERVSIGFGAPKLSPYEAYMKAMNETFPSIEKSLEGDIVQKYKEHLSPKEQFELDMAWKRRLQVTEETEKKPREYLPQLQEKPLENIDPLEEKLYLSKDEFVNLGPKHVGRYIEIPEAAARVLFRNGCFGRYVQDDFSYHSLFAFMIREETVKLVLGLKMNQNVAGARYHEEARAHNKEFLATLKGVPAHTQLEKMLQHDAATYFMLMNRLSVWMNEEIERKGDQQLDMVFRNSPDLFDCGVNLIVSKIPTEPLFKYLYGEEPLDLSSASMAEFSSLTNAGKSKFLELISSFLTSVQCKLTPSDMQGQVSMKKFCEYVSRIIELKFGSSSVIIDMTNFSKFEDWRPRPAFLNTDYPKFSGFNGTTVLTGPSGAGKSGVLNAVALWAHAEGSYVVMKVPRGVDITRYPSSIIWHNSGLYLQPEVAFDILAEFSGANKGLLDKIPVKQELYGKFNVAGLHDVYDKEYIPLPAQHKWLEHLQVYSDDWKKHYDEESLIEIHRAIKETNLEPRDARMDYEIGILSQRPVPPDIEKQFEAYVNREKYEESENSGEGEETNHEEANREETNREETSPEDDGDISDIELEEIVLANDAAKRYPRKIKHKKSSAETLVYSKTRPIYPMDLMLTEIPKITEDMITSDLNLSGNEDGKSSSDDEKVDIDITEAQKRQIKAKSAPPPPPMNMAHVKLEYSSDSSSDEEPRAPIKPEDHESTRFNFTPINEEENEVATVATRLTTHLPTPKNLKEIVDFALRNHIYCTNAICEVLEQLQHTDVVNVLVLVDDFSEFFAPTHMPSLKYANYKECGSNIPTWDLALGRTFMRLDGHRFKNGSKIVAATNYWKPTGVFNPATVNILPQFTMKVEPLTLDDFRMACAFYRSSGWLTDTFTESDIQFTYMHSQGNWRAAHSLLRNYMPISI